MTARQTRNGKGQTAQERSIPARYGWGWIVTLLLFLGVAAWGIHKLQDPQLLPVEVVRIDGQLEHLNRAQLQKQVQQQIQGGFFSIDVASVREAVQKLPWVKEASVRLIWPGTLRMSVVEHVPLALWQEQGLVSIWGDPFQPPVDELPVGLPRFYGPQGSEKQMVEHYFRLKPNLDALGVKLERLRLDARRAWTLTIDDGVEIKLGNSETEQRLRLFYRIYPLLQKESRKISRVDLRYTNGFAVRWQGNSNDETVPVTGLRSGAKALDDRGLT
jgi:cell division protein FtsQ